MTREWMGAYFAKTLFSVSWCFKNFVSCFEDFVVCVICVTLLALGSFSWPCVFGSVSFVSPRVALALVWHR